MKLKRILANQRGTTPRILSGLEIVEANVIFIGYGSCEER